MAQINPRDFLKASPTALAGLPVAACVAHPLPIRYRQRHPFAAQRQSSWYRHYREMFA